MAPRFVVNNKAPTASSASADKDLYFPSPGRFVFRVPEGFNTFLCTVQRTDVGSYRTDLTIEVWQDDQNVFSTPMTHKQESLDISVPLVSGKKVKLMVSCATKLMIGTEVQCKQPRLKR
jgi:hypothetical protein